MSEIWIILQVVLGIGLVIFVHESGHFVAARLCKVRVEVFSLGFGPKLFGWRRGPTQYQVAVLPLGGYVKMAGEDTLNEGRTPAPDELPAKSVAQRFFIYSGGVLANLVFGVVVFPILLAIGVPMTSPVVGQSTPGSPAWQAGLVPGSRVVRVNGEEIQDFMHIPPAVALGPANETTFEVLEPGRTDSRVLRMQPRYNEVLGVYTIGVNPGVDPEAVITVTPDSPAARAGLATGDRLLGVEGASEALPLDEQLAYAERDGGKVRAHFVRLELGADGRETGRKQLSVELTAEASPGASRILGVAPLVDRIVDQRGSGLEASTGLRKEDRLLAVNGLPLLREFDLLDALLRPSNELRFAILRDGVKQDIVRSPLQRAEAIALWNDLALAQDIQSARISVKPQSAAAAAGMLDGDRILSIDGVSVAKFEDVTKLIKGVKHPVRLSIERSGTDGRPKLLEFSAEPREWKAEYGLFLPPAQYVYRAGSPLEAVRVGIGSSLKYIEESWLTLRRILTGQVSGDNVGGIITIGVVSHSWAGQGLAKLFFFLCMLSINLAILNVLPVPVLDGGHLMFLVIEKIKGSPVSERVLGYSQILGLVLLASLMVYVTFNDIKRWFLHS